MAKSLAYTLQFKSVMDKNIPKYKGYQNLKLGHLT